MSGGLMNIGMLIFPDMTQLDFTGPYEVFAQLPKSSVRVIAKTLEPVAAKGGLKFLPDTTIADAPPLDLVFVPGGPGTGALMEDREVLEFLRRNSEKAKYVTSVCTGALVLGAAGLLKGYSATTHWASLGLLPLFGAKALPDRVVTDRNRITGGGVTAGIDFALVLLAEMAGQDFAESIQLGLEYAPAPPFNSGRPELARPEVLASITARMAAMADARTAAVASAAKRLPVS